MCLWMSSHNMVEMSLVSERSESEAGAGTSPDVTFFPRFLDSNVSLESALGLDVMDLLESNIAPGRFVVQMAISGSIHHEDKE